MEEAVTFLNKKGKKLFGILHVPDANKENDKKVGINLLNPGIKYRVAPNRLNIKLARKLCDEGYYVMRFDPEGIGDSEGELPEGILVPDIWEKIQTGLLVDDTIAANDFFIKNYCITDCILIGNCGGAITALLTAKEDQRVSDLVLIDVPVNLRTAQQTFAHKVAEGGKKADFLFEEYMKKIFSFQSWYRFITLQTEYRALWKIINLKFQKMLSPFYKDTFLKKEIDTFCRGKNLNPQFFKSFNSFTSKGNSILFILAGNDPGTEIFQKYFQNTYLKEQSNINGNLDLVDIFLIDHANHVYTLDEWQKALINKTLSWIKNKEAS